MTSDTPSEPRDTLGETEISLTFRKGLQVMMAFDGEDRELTLAEVARKTGLNRSVARRLVRTLLHMGILRETGQRFTMTVGVLRLARGFVDGRRIAQVIQPILRRTADKVGENLSFALRDGADATYVAHAQVTGSFTLNLVAVGTHVPLDRTAAGHAILAHLPRPEWTGGLDPAALDTALEAVRQRGYAFLAGGLIDGVGSLAFPVFGPDQRIEGAVSYLFPTDRYANEGALPAALLAELRQCAVDIGASL